MSSRWASVGQHPRGPPAAVERHEGQRLLCRLRRTPEAKPEEAQARGSTGTESAPRGDGQSSGHDEEGVEEIDPRAEHVGGILDQRHACVEVRHRLIQPRKENQPEGRYR